MSKHRTSSTHRQPWYTRWQAVLLTLGALAGAVLSVLSLWDRVVPADTPDPEDFGAITSVAITKQMSLNRFAELIGDKKAVLAPVQATSGAARPAHLVRVVWAATTPTATPSGDSAAESDRTGAPHQTDGVDAPEEKDATITPEETSNPSSSVSATSESTSTTPGDDTSIQQVSPEAVLTQDPLDDYTIAPEALPVTSLANRTGLSAKEIAQRLARSLAPVESRTVHDKKVPMGYLVAVNIEVSGLKDEPLGLRWSLDGINVPITWKADRQLQYELTAGTDHDSGSVNLWVPNFVKPGVYYVNVELVRASDGTVISHGEPAKVPEFRRPKR